MSRFSHNTSREHPAITEARRFLRARKGPPNDDDRPRRKSRPPRVLDGQLSIDFDGRRDEGRKAEA
jgi:hypothetical protein